jgi:chromosomal replication initiator protein
MEEYKKIWDNCLQVIKDNVNTHAYDTWFAPIVPSRLNGNILTIEVPTPFFYEYLEEHYIDLLRKTLRKELGNSAKLEYSVNVVNDGTTVKYPTQDTQALKNKSISYPYPSGAQGEPRIINPFVIPGLKKQEIDPQLNPEYSMDNFIEGKCNSLARSAGMSIAEQPGKTAFNPIFIYGNSGLGKTHLAQAIGIETKKRYPDKIVLYLDARRFVSQYVDAAVTTNSINNFFYFYQMMDVLIIDDIQELAGKKGTQNTFFHIFNHLQQMGKQLVLTSDKSPVELQGVEQRLLSRFKCGLFAELELPDLETRIAILKQKIYNDGMMIADEVIEYLASNIKANIRELRGALVSLLAQSTLLKKEITVELASEMLSKLVSSEKNEISIEHITRIVCDCFGLTLEKLLSPTKKREIALPRQIAMFLCLHYTKHSSAYIGAQFGGKDHTTVIYAGRHIKDLMDTDISFKGTINNLKNKVEKLEYSLAN